MKTLRSRYARRVLVPVMAVSLLSACSHWTYQWLAPSQVVSRNEPGKVRLTMLDGDKIVLRNPWVSDGEIVGYWAERSDTLRVVADSVTRIEWYETNALATGMGVLFGLVILGGVVVLSVDWDVGCCQ